MGQCGIGSVGQCWGDRPLPLAPSLEWSQRSSFESRLLLAKDSAPLLGVSQK